MVIFDIPPQLKKNKRRSKTRVAREREQTKFKAPIVKLEAARIGFGGSHQSLVSCCCLPSSLSQAAFPWPACDSSLHSFLILPHSLSLSLSLSTVPMSAASSSTTRSQRSTSSISPFRSRKSPAPPPPYTKPTAARPVTPSSSTSSRPPSKLSVSPAASASQNPNPSPPTPTLERPIDVNKSKENVTVTVRFRPLRQFTLLATFLFSLDWSVTELLGDSQGGQFCKFLVLNSAREINKGDEIAWYADGDYTVRNEYNSSITYGFGQYHK